MPTVTGCNTADISWVASQSAFDPMIGNYSVRYQLRNDPSSLNMVYPASNSVTLQDLLPNASYNVSVAGINSCGGTSAFEMNTFSLEGNSIHAYMVSLVLYLHTSGNNYKIVEMYIVVQLY